MYRTFQASLLSPKAGRLCQTAAVCSRSKTTANIFQIKAHIKKKFKIYENILPWFFLPVQVVNSVTTNQECVNDISASEVLAYLLMALPMLPSCKSDIDQNEFETGSHQIQRD